MTAVGMAENDMRRRIMAIMMDTSMNDAEKARARQELMTGGWSKPAPSADAAGSSPGGKARKHDGAADAKAKPTKAAGDGDDGAGGSRSMLDENLKCGVCLNMCERPVTAPCQHNFCLGCFRKWTNQGKRSCPSCRAPFPSKFAENPRINTALTFAIRLAKNPVKASGQAKEYKRIDNEKRPDEAFTTEHAKRAGRANAASGRIMVTIPNDHFGPIPAEHDPDRGQGVLVGEWWKDRLDCRQWGAHFPHVAGIAGQSGVGAQSVVLSGGYEDDRDEGEWFLYTGSGGRDLSGNKRTNKEQSFDQEFTNMNLALKLSCMKGLPVRVVRSFKEKRSSYAPTVDTPVRYDGIYRILSCWRKPGNQGPLVCRYLFVRCDNAPAPWSSAETGDDESLSIPSEAAKEIKQAKGTVFKMSDEPMWSYLEADGRWGWAKPAPSSNRLPGGGTSSATGQKRLRKKVSDHEKALKEFACGVCKEVCTAPLSTPCGHNFCKGCLDDKFEGISDIMAPTARTLRVRRNLKPCPRCNTDLCEFLSKAQVNHEMVGVIATLQQEVAKAKAEAAKLEAEGKAGDAGSGDDEDDDMAVEEACGGAGCSSGGAGSQAAAGGSADPSSSSDDTAAPVDKLPVPPAAAAAAAAAPAPAPAPAPPRYRYADELAQLVELFPGGDPVLMKDLLEDQGGDVADVSVMLKKMMAPARKHVAKKEKEAAPAKKAKEAAKIEEAASAKQVAVAAEAEEEAVAAEAEEDAALTTAVAAAENERLTGRTAAECAAAAAKPAPKKRGRPANKAAAAPSKKAETVCQADGAESEDPIQDASDTDVTPKKKKQRGRK